MPCDTPHQLHGYQSCCKAEVRLLSVEPTLLAQCEALPAAERIANGGAPSHWMQGKHGYMTPFPVCLRGSQEEDALNYQLGLGLLQRPEFPMDARSCCSWLMRWLACAGDIRTVSAC